MPQGPARSLTLSSRETEWLSLILIGGLLAGYALFSKGFAYLGRPPLFIGEIVLGLCLVLFMLRPDFKLLRMPGTPWLIVAFCLFCLTRTIPYFEDYGLMSLRDSVLYGYAIFAFLVGTLMARQSRLQALLPAYDITSLLIILASPLVIFLSRHQAVSQITDTPPLIFQKAGDISVHLAGAACFRLVGLNGWQPKGPATLKRMLNICFWAAWVVSAAWAAATSRAAMLTIIVSMALVFCAGFGRRIILMGASLIVALSALFTAFNLGIHQSGRDVSGSQIWANALSVIGYDSGSDGDADVSNLKGTMKWRTDWWQKIIETTLDEDYALTGRGFGVNLAAEDGFQVDINDRLRSPHNIHMNVLARTGFAGLFLWILLLGWFFRSLWLSARRMRARGLAGWHAVGIWILTYWLATMVNGSFDVYIEGPQGGIWAWSLMGVGMAVIWLERHARPSEPGQSAAGLAPDVA
ncbi:O-antigen ligase family protein [Nitrospirillum iridis]|uniref:Uncharacterized membrane protein YhaH (DUF805 family) n=1 Tax=Nitrospirillum iridis TaxID=765888 RepID=A0A7X0B0U8_9PROT|nr:O-antigen ligase family protein [Nitrospirillum iridis]MBB6253702.1 uncharacterized membrane protein YhaH (DUF805 family) [Nitrospirillum iridis]